MSAQLDIFLDALPPAVDVVPTPTPDCYVGDLPVRIPVDVEANSRAAEALKRCVDRVYYETHDIRVFSTCCDVWWAVLEQDEEAYANLSKGWSRGAFSAASEAFSVLLNHFVYEGGFYDVLGDAYMQVRSDWGGKYLGQYFTPWPVCLAMAALTAGELPADRLKNGPPVTVQDPACGSGSMLLALQAHVAQTHGRRALRMVRCYGQDIDATCVTMAKIQQRLVNVPYMLNWLMVRYGEIGRELVAEASP